MGIKPFRGKFKEIIGVAPVDLEILDQREQSEFVGILEWFGPYMLCAYMPGPGGWSGKGVVEMGNDGDVPGVAGQ